jgi:putative mRNA 3-end processing factor
VIRFTRETWSRNIFPHSVDSYDKKALMLVLTKKGLYCPAGNFHIDPRGAVERAVITHAHSDHATRGSQQYYCTQSGTGLLRGRLGQSISVSSFEYGATFRLGEVEVSFHPAGHILGSAQIRIEYSGEVWVASGDYKREFDPTCEPFESVRCDVFITEATFGTPSYQWPQNHNVAQEILDWWTENSALGLNSVLFAYSLGKTQRVLGLLEPFRVPPIYCHSAARVLNDCYRDQGIRLAPTVCLGQVALDSSLRGELFIVPRSFMKSPQARLLGHDYRTAFASGWMAKRAEGYDRGFIMSDHADWNDLLRTVSESQAKRVYVQHRGHGALVKHLRTLGIKAFPDSRLIPENPQQLAFFT